MSACKEFIDLHDKLGAKGRAQWWAQQALREQQSQMDVLGGALPRAGGRVAPQLLDFLTPTEISSTESAMRNVIACIGVQEGLSGVLGIRSAVREAAVAIGPRTPAGFALERMDRRLQDLLSIWLSPGMLRVTTLREDSPPELREAAKLIAESAHPILAGKWSAGLPHHRCFMLHHPMMKGNVDSQKQFLFSAHAAILPSMPKSLNDIVNQPPSLDGSHARVACFWSLGTAFPGECFRGLGLGRELFYKASQLVRKEIGTPEVCALVPLLGFTKWLRERRAWETFREDQPGLADMLKRALENSHIENKEVQFVDADGDSLHFRFSRASGLEVAVGGQSFQPVIRLRVAETDGIVMFLTGGDQGQALQVEAPQEAVSRGDLKAVEEMAEASGIFPMHMRDSLLRLGEQYLLRKFGNGKRMMDPVAHFHFSSGASFGELLWRADESLSGRAESFGIMATFVYDDVHEAEQAAAYTERGTIFSREPVQM